MLLALYAQLALQTGGTPGSGVELENPLGVTSFTDLIDNITGYLVIIAAPIVTLMIFYAAFQILTAGGNPEKVTQGRKTITYAVIGYAIILASKGLTMIIAEVLGG